MSDIPKTRHTRFIETKAQELFHRLPRVITARTPLKVPLPGLKSWLVFSKVMSYYGHYDAILRLLENLCRSARITVVSRSQGILLKNESKYSLWHPYS